MLMNFYSTLIFYTILLSTFYFKYFFNYINNILKNRVVIDLKLRNKKASFCEEAFYTNHNWVYLSDFSHYKKRIITITILSRSSIDYFFHIRIIKVE